MEKKSLKAALARRACKRDPVKEIKTSFPFFLSSSRNTAKGFKLIEGWFKSLHIERVHACLEATGVYGETVAEFLYERGHRVSVVNPLRIKGFAKSDLKRNKTDEADAHTIAAFCPK